MFEKDLEDFDVFLFGSRSMAQKEPYSDFNPKESIILYSSTDYDFSTEFNLAKADALINRGFTLVGSDYIDDLTAAILVKEYKPKFCRETMRVWSTDEVVRVHIVTHSNELLFRAVWSSINPLFYYLGLWKRGPMLSQLDPSDAKKLITASMNQLYKTYAHS
jgi:hypothetical protein